MLIVGFCVLAFWIGVPLYLIGLIIYCRWKKRGLGALGWFINAFVVVLWLVSIVLPVAASHHAAATASDPSTSIYEAAINSAKSAPPANIPTTMPAWDAAADGNSWLQYSEADKQQFCAAAAAVSVNQHPALFFYTNINASYHPDEADSLKTLLSALFVKFDSISPGLSYPSLLGFSWKRMNTVRTAKGEVEMILVFWPDGRTYLHSQGIQPDGSYTVMGLDGPWDGDLYTGAGTTTVSGNTFTMNLPGTDEPTQSGTFQVSADSEEMDMTEDGRPPSRYAQVSRIMNSPLPALFPSDSSSGK